MKLVLTIVIDKKTSEAVVYVFKQIDTSFLNKHFKVVEREVYLCA